MAGGFIAGLLLLTGCGTTVAEKAARSAEITATGQATIENFVQKGLTTSRVYLRYLDGEFLQTNGTKGVYALAPGEHDLIVGISLSRMTVADLMMDGAEWKPRLRAEAGTRYRLRGRRLDVATAEVWIEDATHNRTVIGPEKVSLVETAQNVSIVIPIPVPK